MTVTQLPAPPGLGVRLAQVHEAIGGIDADATIPPGAYAAAVVEVDRAIRRLEAVKLRLVAGAQRARVATRTGHTDTGAWLAQTTRSTGRDAAGAVKLADSLDRRLPATQQAPCPRAVVSRDHAAVIDHAIRQLPSGLTPGQRAEVEAVLVDKAKLMDPAALRKAGRRALARVEPDEAVVDAHEDHLVRTEEDHAWDHARLTLRDNGDGTTTGHFTIPTLSAAILQRTLHTLASPRRATPGATHAHAGHPSEGVDGLGWDRRLGQAFVEILDHLPTDRLHHKTAATIIVTLHHDQLVTQLKAAGVDTGEMISSSTARRMACQAGLLPAVLGRKSHLLDLGHTARFFTHAQALALATRHTTCAADGCDRPYAWTELHHRNPWAQGGTTNLRDAIPLCGHHHRRIHHPNYTHQERPGPNGLPVITFRQRC